MNNEENTKKKSNKPGKEDCSELSDVKSIVVKVSSKSIVVLDCSIVVISVTVVGIAVVCWLLVRRGLDVVVVVEWSPQFSQLIHRWHTLVPMAYENVPGGHSTHFVGSLLLGQYL